MYWCLMYLVLVYVGFTVVMTVVSIVGFVAVLVACLELVWIFWWLGGKCGCGFCS